MSRVRENLSDRITLERLTLEAKRSRGPVALILIGAVIAAVLGAYILGKVGFNPLTDRQTVAFQVNTARAVVPNSNEVSIKGIPAGRVNDVELRDGVAIITASFDRKYGSIYRDAKARLRPNTALQDMVLDVVDRGTPAAGVAREDVPLSPAQTDTSVDVADVLGVFEPNVRANLATLLDQLGNGLEDGGARLRAAFVELAPTVALVDRIAVQVRRRKAATQRLVTNASVLTQELGRRETAVRRLVHRGGDVLRTLETAQTDLDRTLAAFPATLGALETSFATVRRVLPDVDTAVTALRPTARRLPAGLDAALALARDARPAVTALQTPVRRLLPLTRVLRPVAADLDGALAALAPQVPAIDHVTAALDRCTKSSAVQNFFQWTPSVTKFEDNHGATVRGDLVASVGSATVVRDPGLEPGLRSCVATLPKAGQP